MWSRCSALRWRLYRLCRLPRWRLCRLPRWLRQRSRMTKTRETQGVIGRAGDLGRLLPAPPLAPSECSLKKRRQGSGDAVIKTWARARALAAPTPRLPLLTPMGRSGGVQGWFAAGRSWDSGAWLAVAAAGPSRVDQKWLPPPSCHAHGAQLPRHLGSRREVAKSWG